MAQRPRRRQLLKKAMDTDEISEKILKLFERDLASMSDPDNKDPQLTPEQTRKLNGMLTAMAAFTRARDTKKEQKLEKVSDKDLMQKLLESDPDLKEKLMSQDATEEETTDDTNEDQ